MRSSCTGFTITTSIRSTGCSSKTKAGEWFGSWFSGNSPAPSISYWGIWKSWTCQLQTSWWVFRSQSRNDWEKPRNESIAEIKSSPKAAVAIGQSNLGWLRINAPLSVSAEESGSWKDVLVRTEVTAAEVYFIMSQAKKHRKIWSEDITRTFSYLLVTWRRQFI